MKPVGGWELSCDRVSGNSDLHVELLTKYGGRALGEVSGVSLLVLAVWGLACKVEDLLVLHISEF